MNFGTIVRLAAIALGIMSALALARDGLGFPLLPFLDAIITAYGIFFDDLFKDLVLAAFEPLFAVLKNWFDWKWDLFPHWKHVFMLLWMFNASDLRGSAPLSLLLGRLGSGTAIRVAFKWVWAALAALIGGALAGTVPVDHPALLWWPVTTFFLLRSFYNFTSAFGDRLWAAAGALQLAFAMPFAALALGWVEPPAVAGQPGLLWWPLAAYFAFWVVGGLIGVAAGRGYFSWVVPSLVVAAVTGALALGVLPGPAWLEFGHSHSPGLANLAAFIAVIAAWYLLRAFLVHRQHFDRVFADHATRTALEVFAVLGGAATIVYVGHLLA